MNETEKLSFARGILQNTYDLTVIEPIDETAALAEVSSDVDGLLNLNQPATMERRFRHFNIPGTSPAEYQERFFDFDSNRRFLAGIRHAGNNPNLPFVHVTADFTLNPTDITRVASLIKSEFKVFNPSHLAYWTKTDFSATDGNLRPARRYLAARISKLNLDEGNRNDKRLELISNDDYWSMYEAEYEVFHQKNPTLKSWVTASDKEDLDRYRSQGLLYSFHINGKMVGLIGAEKSDLLGLRGLYVGELLIKDEFKGHGYAAFMQRQFLRVVGSPFQVVWGTIDARNLSSIKTALKIGRVPMRTELFAPFI